MNKKLLSSMQRDGIDAMILCRPDNVAYATGFDTPLSYGASDSCVDGAFTYVIADAQRGTVTLLAADSCYGGAKANSFADRVVPFGTMHFFKDENYPNCLYDLMGAELDVALKGAKKVAVEYLAAPWFVYEAVNKRFDGATLDAQPYLDQLRVIKQPYEIERLRKVASALDAGHEEFKRQAREFEEGLTEYDVYFSVYKAIFGVSGKVTLTGDVATGERVGHLSGIAGPRDRVIQRGDNGIFDTSIRLDGYWCDCANTVTFGAKPSEVQLDYYKMVREVFDTGIAAMKPGNTLRGVDEIMKKVFNRYGHEPIVYSGHHVGCNVNEPPRILCYDQDTPIEPNMVVCLEPQNFSGKDDGIGVRLEHLILVTENGAEELNKFSWGYSDIC